MNDEQHRAREVGGSDHPFPTRRELRERERQSIEQGVRALGASDSAQAPLPEPLLPVSGDDDADQQPPTGPGGPRRGGRGRRWIWWAAILLVLGGLVAGGLIGGKALVSDLFASESDDYDGAGGEQVTFVIRDGQGGGDIGDQLVSQGIVKSYKAFLREVESRQPKPVFHAGAYIMRQQMSASSAVDALLDDANRTDLKVTIPEGFSQDQVITRFSKATGIPEDDFRAVLNDLDGFAVPQQAKEQHTLEGFLFPATYQYDPSMDAAAVLHMLVDRANQALDQHGVSGDDERFRVATFAALVQREAGSVDDMGKVARVFQNRLDGKLGNPVYLQSDASVAYGTGRTDDVETTPEERADASNKYNTYANPGLPVGPISNPGDDAIAAVLNPTPGDWLYFVTVNTQTGETKFATTKEEFDQYVREWQNS